MSVSIKQVRSKYLNCDLPGSEVPIYKYNYCNKTTRSCLVCEAIKLLLDREIGDFEKNNSIFLHYVTVLGPGGLIAPRINYMPKMYKTGLKS